MKRTSLLSLATLITIIVLTACRSTPPQPATNSEPQSSTVSATSLPAQNSNANTSTTAGMINVKAEVWADNWFAFYLGDQLVKEDSGSITTERSFNSETFTFSASYPLTLNFIAKDFKENDTGLEYIGTNRQQMGDGGLIAQFTNADTGELIAVTDSNWSCTVIHEAPLDKSCERESNPVTGQAPCGFTSLEEPLGWKDADFDTSSWSNASIYTADQVSPKDGYDQISWDSSAQFIWGSDLETSNTVLCKLIVSAP